MSRPRVILVVDDDPILRRATARTLRKADFDVREASTVAEARAAVRDQRPDLVLLDVVLPDGSGRALCEEITRDPSLEGVSVILLSSTATLSMEQAEGIEGGEVDFIVRPVSSRELLARVRAVVRLKDAHEALKAERDRAASFLDLVQAVVVALDREGTITLINRKGAQVLGWAPDELVGRNWFQTCLPASVRDEVWAVFRRIMAGEIEALEYGENEVITSSGQERIIAWHNTVLRGPDGVPVGTLSSGEDVTERRRAAEAAEQERQRLRGVLDAVPFPISLLAADHTFRFVNRAFVATFGDPKGRPCYEMFKGRSQPCEACPTLPLLGMTEVRDGEWTDPSGRTFALSDRPFTDADGTPLVMEVHHGITALREAQRLLAAERDTLRTLINAAPVALRVLDKAMRVTLCNATAARMFGWTEGGDEVRCGDVIACAHRHDGPGGCGTGPRCQTCPLNTAVREVLAGGRPKHDLEVRVDLQTSGGVEERMIVMGVEPLEVSGRPHALVALHDTTDLRRAQDALRESMARNEALLSALPDLLFVLSADGTFLDYHASRADLLFVAPDHFLGRRPEEVFPPAFAAEVRDLVRRTVERQALQVLEYELPLAWQARHFEARMVPFGKDRVLCVIRDITAEKTAQEEARVGEERYKRLVESLAEGLIQSDLEDRIQFVNDRFCELVGRRREELLGRVGYEVFAPEEDREVIRSTTALMRQGMSDTYETRFVRPDGKVIWVSISGSPVYGPKGDVIGSMALVSDITARKEAQARLAEALEEKEALLREIHHRVKGNLQAVSSLIEITACGVDPKTQRSLRVLVERVRTMAGVHEQLYESANLARVEMEPFLRSLADNLVEAFGGGAHVVVRVEAPGVWMGLEEAMPCALIVNELVTNALTHAFPRDVRSEGTIGVSILPCDDSWVLEVRDDGVGFPPGVDWRRGGSMGFHLVGLWATHQLGGTVEVEGAAGTRFVVRFPRMRRRHDG